MRKRITVLLIICTITLIGWSCAQTPKEPTEDETSLTTGWEIDSGQLLNYGNILGKNDEEVIALMGEGEAAYVRGDTEENISARLYQKNILGFNGETVLDFNNGENPVVEEVLITFSDTSFDDVVDVISQQLGEVTMIERTENNNGEALWLYDDIAFDLTYYGGTLLLTIGRNNEVN